MPSLKHIHTFKRVKATRDGKHFLYMCIDPHCTYRVDKLYLVGKAALCNSCHQEFILTGEDLRRAKPICQECSNTAKSREFRARRDTLKSFFGEQVEVTND